MKVSAWKWRKPGKSGWKIKNVTDNRRVLNNTAYFVLEEVRKMEQKIRRAVRLLLPVICFVVLYQTGFAAEGDVDLSQITDPIDIVYTIFAAIISAVGALYALSNFVNMLSAIQSHDMTQQISSGIRFGISIVLTMAPWILKYVLKIGA